MKPENGLEQERLYTRVLENIEEGIIAVNQDGRINLFNPAAQLFTGLSERQAFGNPIEDVFKGQDTILYLIHAGLRSGRPISDHEDIHLQRAHAPPLPVSISVSPIYQENGQQDGLVLIIHNLSRVKELEKAMRQADRLSVLGSLAAGLAHEIKNPLGGIKGAAQLLAMELEGSENLKEFTQVMIREVERVNGIIEELMDLTRPRSAQWEEVDLSRILNDVVLLQKEAHRKKEVKFALHLDPSIPPIQGDLSHLTQLFVNLVKNAAEAVDAAGRVEITTKVSHDYNYRKPGDAPAPVIVVEVKDNGPGIPGEEIDRIFTPFYTTKSKGSGLGLPTCQKIADEHGALLKFNSEPGNGTVFSVSIPFHPFAKKDVKKGPKGKT
ncbi:MAG: PAS domain S-box protein [Deltaproteobacteria bacterium]|nr:PAS domain S-box protein [Deltaproteobacteria bacterium]